MTRSDFFWLMCMVTLLLARQGNILMRLDRLLGDKESERQNMHGSLLWSVFAMCSAACMFYYLFTGEKK